MSKELECRARELLAGGSVAAVIGYAEGAVPDAAAPVVITAPDEAERLVLSPFCYNNLAVYLTRPEIKKLGRVGVVAKDADIRAIFVLMQENQIAREDVHIIGVSISRLGDPSAECRVLPYKTHEELLGHLVKNVPPAELSAIEDVAQLEDADRTERWAYWQNEFSRCIRCYACRQVCPLCYCTSCIAEKNRPQWIETSAHERGNFAWNITRAFHLAGRCVGCGECERACPAGIPLMKLNRKMAKEVRDNFHGYVAGYAFEGEALFAGHRPDDPDDFFE